jgi:hypothetical protein
MTLPITITVGNSETSAPVHYTGWRGLHWIQEGGRPVAYRGAPAVIPPIETVVLPMTRAIQLMSFALMQKINPFITAKKWHALHGHAVAMNNGDQNGYDGGILHVDYVEGTNLGATPPRYDKMQRTFGGTFIQGEIGYSVMQSIRDAVTLMRQMIFSPRRVMGTFRKSFSALAQNNVIHCLPGVHGIDATKPLPDTQTIIKNNWYVIAVTAGDEIYNFPQGQGGWVVYPFIFDRPISFQLGFFHRWDRDYLPDPLKTYALSNP